MVIYSDWKRFDVSDWIDKLWALFDLHSNEMRSHFVCTPRSDRESAWKILTVFKWIGLYLWFWNKQRSFSHLLFLFVAVCGQPSVPLNAKVKTSVSGQSGISEAHYECDSGYELFGPSVTKCDPKRGWEKDLPFCGKYSIVPCKFYNPFKAYMQIFTFYEAATFGKVDAIPASMIISLNFCLRKESRLRNEDFNFPSNLFFFSFVLMLKMMQIQTF